MKNNRKYLCYLLLALIACICLSNPAYAKKGKPKIKSVQVTIDTKNVTKKTYTLSKTDGRYIVPVIKPANAVKSISYKSSNKKIVSVASNGFISCKKPGTAKITITIKGVNKKIKTTWVKIKVKGIAYAGTLTNKPQSVTLEKNKTKFYKFTPTVSGTYYVNNDYAFGYPYVYGHCLNQGHKFKATKGKTYTIGLYYEDNPELNPDVKTIKKVSVNFYVSTEPFHTVGNLEQEKPAKATMQSGKSFIYKFVPKQSGFYYTHISRPDFAPNSVYCSFTKYNEEGSTQMQLTAGTTYYIRAYYDTFSDTSLPKSYDATIQVDTFPEMIDQRINLGEENKISVTVYNTSMASYCVGFIPPKSGAYRICGRKISGNDVCSAPGWTILGKNSTCIFPRDDFSVILNANEPYSIQLSSGYNELDNSPSVFEVWIEEK